MDKISIALENGKEGSLEVVEELFQIDEANHNMLRVFQSPNFFGKPVTIGYMVREVQGEDDRPTVQITVKAAVCADSDTFDARHGSEVVIGRLMLADDTESLCTISVKGRSYVMNLSRGLLAQKAHALAEYLESRKEMLSDLRQHEQSMKTILGNEFSEFK